MSESLASENCFDEQNQGTKEESPEVKSGELSISDSGVIEATTDQGLLKAMLRYQKMNLIPRQFKTIYVAAGAWLFALQNGFENPLTVWGEIAEIHGKFSFYGTLFRGIAKRSPEFGEDEIFFLDEKQERICADNKNLDKSEKPWAAVVRTKKKGGTIWNEFSFTIDEARKADLYPAKRRDGSINNDSPWEKYQKDMLLHKAIARSYKLNYSDALSGVQMYEDLISNTTEREIGPLKSDSFDLNQIEENNGTKTNEENI